MIPNMHLAKVGGIHDNATRKPDVASPVANPTTSFRDILDSQLPTAQPVQFSKHAALRLNDRNISLTGEQINRVSDGIGKADEKGIRDSLVLVDDVALVVNVKSRTVITAIPQLQENIFSNIDGAVIV
jgi:flagellar operon protein